MATTAYIGVYAPSYPAYGSSTSPGNQTPTATISGASSGVVGTAQQFTATASDSDGTIAKVDLCLMANATELTNFTILDTDTFAPYALNWTPSSAGNFILRVRATDNQNAVGFSSALTVGVTNSGATTQLAAPSSVQATPVSASTISFACSPVSNNSGYALEISANNTGPWTQAYSGPNSSYSLRNLNPLTPRFGRWRALGTGNYTTSDYSAVATATTQAAPTVNGITGFTPNAAQVGETVEIDGLGFGSSQGAGYVLFNQTQVVQVASWSDTKITVLVPADATPGHLSVVTNGNVTYVSAGYFLPLSTDAFDLNTSSFGQIGATITNFGLINGLPRFSTTNTFGGNNLYTQPGTAAVTESDFQLTPYTFVGPSMGVSADISQTFGSGTDVLRVGLVMNSTTDAASRSFINAEYNASNQTLAMTMRNKDGSPYGGNGAFVLVNGVTLPSRPEAVGLAVSGVYVSMWARYNGVWQLEGTREMNFAYCFEFWRESVLATVLGGYVQFVSGSNAGASYQLTQVQVGYLKGVGAANWAPVKRSDGSFYQDGTSILLGGSIAHVSAQHDNSEANIAASCGVLVKLNVVTGSYEEMAYLWNVRNWDPGNGNLQARLYGDNAYAWTYDDSASIWRCLAGRWGGIVTGEPHMGVQGWTASSLPLGPIILRNGVELPLILPAPYPPQDTYGYDCDWQLIDGTYHLVYAVGANGSPTPREVRHVTASDLFNGPYTLVAGSVPGSTVNEGTKLLNLNGVTKILYTNDGQNSLVTNLDFTQTGVITRTDTGQSVNPTHPALFPLSDGKGGATMWFFAYDGTLFDTRSFTVGQGRLLRATKALPTYTLPSLPLPI